MQIRLALVSCRRFCNHVLSFMISFKGKEYLITKGIDNLVWAWNVLNPDMAKICGTWIIKWDEVRSQCLYLLISCSFAFCSCSNCDYTNCVHECTSSFHHQCKQFSLHAMMILWSLNAVFVSIAQHYKPFLSLYITSKVSSAISPCIFCTIVFLNRLVVHMLPELPISLICSELLQNTYIAELFEPVAMEMPWAPSAHYVCVKLPWKQGEHTALWDTVYIHIYTFTHHHRCNTPCTYRNAFCLLYTAWYLVLCIALERFDIIACLCDWQYANYTLQSQCQFQITTYSVYVTY